MVENDRSNRLLGLLLAAVLLLGILAAYNLAHEIGRPFGGFRTSRSINSGYWYLGMATPPWWPGMLDTGLSPEDRLVMLDGQAYGQDQWRTYDRAYAEGRHQVPLIVERKGERVALLVPVGPFTLAQFLEIKIPDLLVGLGFWLLALTVLLSRPDESTGQLFIALAGLMAGVQWLGHYTIFPDAGHLTRFLDFVTFVFVFPFATAMVAHFALAFPNRSKLYHPTVIRLLYGGTSLVIILIALARLLFWSIGSTPAGSLLDNFSYRVPYYLLAVGATLLIVRLMSAALPIAKSPGARRHRRIAFLALISILIATPVGWVAAKHALTVGPNRYFWNGLDLRYVALAVPIAFAFIILRYKAFRNGHPLFLAVAVLAISALVSSLASWAIHLMQPQLAQTIAPAIFLIVFAAIFTTSLFWTTQSTWSGYLGRFFHWDQRSYAAVKKFGARLVDSGMASSVSRRIVVASVAELELEGAAIWMNDTASDQCGLVAQAGWMDKNLPQHVTLPDRLDSLTPLRVSTCSQGKQGWVQTLAAIDGIEVAAALGTSDARIGVLALGRRWDEEIFDERDLEIVQLMAQQVSLFLLTEMQMQELRQVPRRVAAVQESERYRIAHELHDTVQQFLGRLPFLLTASRVQLRTAPDASDSILSQCVTDATQQAATIRRIVRNLAPSQLERGLIEPLQQLVRAFQQRCEIAVQLEAPAALDDLTNSEIRLVLYRVVQQALDNVAAHAEATAVSLCFTPEHGRIRFTVKDNGRGFSEQQRVQALLGGHFGLQSMAARVRTVGGELAIESETNLGTCITGWVPPAGH